MEWPKQAVDYGPVIPYKMDLLRQAHIHFVSKGTAVQKEAFAQFCQEQAEWLDRYLQTRLFETNGLRRVPLVVISIKVGYNELLRRLAGRRCCPTCGRIYNIYFQPPRVAEICDLDGTQLITRRDDREEVISERLKAYERQTLPLVEYYGTQGRLHEVDGTLPMEQVMAEALSIIENGNRI